MNLEKGAIDRQNQNVEKGVWKRETKLKQTERIKMKELMEKRVRVDEE